MKPESDPDVEYQPVVRCNDHEPVRIIPLRVERLVDPISTLSILIAPCLGQRRELAEQDETFGRTEHK
ncbi:hypothetical protein Y032_0106g3772 [Ancylostoma ceylanicum]|uniref:Uncharacterized protein n=1 Tax=Ancylostoma ceylanicum TaxID=53326 RepID=A0A016TG15_9BILA|nr:hypothetical protein Y032_0106g3772 [Ancylostoma ceylanicum]